MKKTLLLCLLLAYSLMGYAQSSVYDSATRYRISPSFNVAMDTLINRAAADPGDTGEDNESAALMRYKNFMGNRICLDVPPGADMRLPMRTALSSYMTYFDDYCPGSGFTDNLQCWGRLPITTIPRYTRAVSCRYG